MGGEMSTFNIQDGYAEALVRGMRSGFLTPDDYRKLSMAESLEDLRSALEETDYGGFLQDEPSPLAAPTVGARARDKLVAEFRFIRAQANANLGRFMDLLVNERMIDNVVNLIQGCLNQKSPDELLGRVDPLGWVPELKAITVLDFSAGYEDLYRSLLVDTPIGKREASVPLWHEPVRTSRATSHCSPQWRNRAGRSWTFLTSSEKPTLS
eukprot:Polyplicarium_translucidae@DN2684_c0_g1_i2.p2